MPAVNARMFCRTATVDTEATFGPDFRPATHRHCTSGQYPDYRALHIVTIVVSVMKLWGDIYDQTQNTANYVYPVFHHINWLWWWWRRRGGGGDGSSSSSSQEPSLTVLPADFNFGIVTTGNFAESLEVTIQNTGTADLDVTSIVLSDTSNFDLNLNAGNNPCASNAPTITAGSSCTATVNFTPTTYNTFSTDLTIQSNDPNSPIYHMNLMGVKQDITAVNVKINEIKACPRPSPLPLRFTFPLSIRAGFR